MTQKASPGRAGRAGIGARPAADPASQWVQQSGPTTGASAQPIFTARLTLDVTPALRGRIKVTAFRRGLTAAHMLRELLEREYPEEADDAV